MAKDLKRDPVYRRASINELEAVYTDANSNTVILNALALELTYRSTDRAGRLRSRISADLAGSGDPQSDLDFGRSRTTPVTDREYSSAAPTLKPAPQAPEPTPVTTSTSPVADELPPLVDFEDLPTISLPHADNDPAAILSAWTALEALDPLTFRRPFDLVGGDRILAAIHRLRAPPLCA